MEISSEQVIKNYIEEKKEFYSHLLEYLEQENETDEFPIFKDILHKEQYLKNKDEVKELLKIVLHIADNYHRSQVFNEKIKKIIRSVMKEIKQALSNDELFDIFQSNKMILLYLIENEMITITEHVYKSIENNGQKYCHFFYPEIKKFINEDKAKDIEAELLEYDSKIFDKYEQKRREGENEDYLCSLIRNDSVQDFISHVNRANISLSREVDPSVFETNSFLIENNPTLIEYSAFFGSIEIFQYLQMNKAVLTPKIWLFAIHSQNADLIHLLETSKVEPPNNDYLNCFNESIKCHHNNFASYFENNYNFDTKKNEENVSTIFKYHNYAYFPVTIEINDEFFYLCSNYNYTLVNEYLKMKQPEMLEFII